MERGRRMAVNVQNEKIQIEYLVAQEKMEKSIEGRIIPPQDRPAVKKILDLQGHVEEVQGAIVEDGVEITGRTFLNLIYSSTEDAGEGPFFFWEKTDFRLFFSTQKAQAGMDLLLDANIRDLKYSRAKDGGVEIMLTLAVRIKVLEKRELSFITGIDGLEEEAIIHREEVILEELIEERREMVELTEEIREEDLENLYYYAARIRRLVEEEQDGKVVVSGELELSLIYGSSDVDHPLVLKKIFDFQQELKLKKSPIQGRINNLTELVKVHVEPFSPGRLSVNICLDILLKIVQRDSYSIITGIESRRVEVQQELLNLENVVDVNRVQNTALFNHNLPPEKEDLKEILYSQAAIRESITEANSGGAKITGQLQGSILYLSTEEGRDRIHLLADNFFFEDFLPLEKARSGMMAETTIFIRRVEGEILNQRTLELAITLDEMVKVTSEKDLMIIKDLVVISPILEKEQYPSMILYVVKPRDTLWKIARRFGAQEEEILRDNKGRILDAESLVAGEKLFIRCSRIGAQSED